ncbi:MAG: hypothetical protein LBH57_02860 [Treponema sp.]|jgi:hypothetical protein|nr:hypothetical protein [Treponema sp.]
MAVKCSFAVIEIWASIGGNIFRIDWKRGKTTVLKPLVSSEFQTKVRVCLVRG